MSLPASISVLTDHKVTSQDVKLLSEIFESIFKYYSFKYVNFVDVTNAYDPVEEKWEYIFSAYGENGIILITETFKLKLLTKFKLSDYIGLRLVSNNILAYMTELAKNKSFYYQPWGVLVDKEEVDQSSINLARVEIEELEKRFFVFIKSDAILKVSDDLEIYHNILLDRFIIVKLTKPIGEIMDKLIEVLS